MPQTLIIKKMVASKFLNGHRQPVRNTDRTKNNVHEWIDDAVSGEHARRVGDLPPVQNPSRVKAMSRNRPTASKNKSESMTMVRMCQCAIPKRTGAREEE